MANTVNVIIKADDQASREIDNVTGSTSKLGSMMQSVGAIATGFIAANVVDAGFRAITDGVNNAIAGWKEHLQVAAQTEAAIKSTGAAAGLTAQQVEDLANQFKATTLFEDDVIQSGENLLLTFTNIGADVFPRATQAMLDMSQRMGQDVSTSAIQLGKALNDPIAGVTSLRRVGVQLSDQQEEQIKTMVEAGDVAGAQAVILAELEKEFGGSAQAASDAAGANAVLDDRLDDLNDTIGEKLLPVQLKFKEAQLAVITFILEEAIPAIESFIDEHQKLFDSIGTVIQGISDAWPKLTPVFEAVGASIAAVAEGIATTLEGTVEMVQGTVDLISAIVHGDWQGAWDAVGTIVGGAAKVVVGSLETMNASVVGVFQAMGVDIDGAVENILSILGRLRDIGTSLIRGLLEGAQGMTGELVNWFFGLPGMIVDQIPNPLGVLFYIGKQLIQGLMDGIISMAQSVANAAANVVKGAVSAAKNALGIHSPSKVFHEIGENTMAGLAGGIDAGSALVTGSVGSVASQMIGAGASASGGGGGGNVYHINVASLDPRTAADLVLKTLVDLERRGGVTPGVTRALA